MALMSGVEGGFEGGVGLVPSVEVGVGLVSGKEGGMRLVCSVEAGSLSCGLGGVGSTEKVDTQTTLPMVFPAMKELYYQSIIRVLQVLVYCSHANLPLFVFFVPLPLVEHLGIPFSFAFPLGPFAERFATVLFVYKVKKEQYSSITNYTVFNFIEEFVGVVVRGGH